MNVLTGFDGHAVRELGVAVTYGDFFNGNDAVASCWKYGAGHNFDAGGA